MPNLFTQIKSSAPLMLIRRIRQRFLPRPEDIGIGQDHPLRFVQNSTGVIHIGAHRGEEAWIYNAFNLPVLWVEANPNLVPALTETISRYPKQKVIQALLTSQEGEEIDFWITNNDGASSSILPLGEHTKMFPGVEVTEKLLLASTTLEAVLSEHDNKRKLNSMIIDVQGAELEVLRGAGERITQFKNIYAECADFEIYRGCCTLSTLGQWLEHRGFSETRRDISQTTKGVGNTYDVLFQRKET